MAADVRSPAGGPDRSRGERPFSPAPPSLRGALRARLVEWRHTGWFRHAHHPLCTHYAVDVIRLGRLHLCRGCTAVYATAALAFPTLLIVGFPEQTWWRGAFVALALAVGLVSHPGLYARLPRPGKDLVRAALGLLIGAWGASLCGGDPLFAALAALPLLGLHRFYGRLRSRQESHTRCLSCPEYREGTICSGFTRQAEAHRALEEAWSTEAMARSLRRATAPPSRSTPEEESSR